MLRKQTFLKIVIVATSVVGFFQLSASVAAAPSLVWSQQFSNSRFSSSSPNLVQLNGGTQDIIVGGTTPYGGGLFTQSNARVFDGDDGTVLRTFSAPANGI